MDDSERARVEQLKMSAACSPPGGSVNVPSRLFIGLCNDHDAYRHKLAEVRAEVDRLRRVVNSRPEPRR